MNTQDAMKIAEEHLASYLRLATSHEGKSLEDDEEALMWHDKADAIADLMDDFKKAGAGLIRCKDCKYYRKDGDCWHEWDNDGRIYYQSIINEPKPDDYCSRAKRKEE